MRKVASLLLKGLASMAMAALVCCHGFHHGVCAEKEDKTRHVLATTFPVWQFAGNVLKGAKNVELELLVPASAGCPHDYAPSPADMRKLARADIIVMNGCGLEDFLDKAVKEIAPHAKIVDAGANITAIRENGHINPHIFAAPKEAAAMAENIGAALARLDPANADVYAANSRQWADKMGNLAKRFEEMGAKAKNRGIALEHDALAYLARNAALKIEAIVEGHASAANLARLRREFMNNPPALLAADSQFSDHSMETLAKETGLPLARLDPCASGPASAPLDYYEKTMENNLKTLAEYFD